MRNDKKELTERCQKADHIEVYANDGGKLKYIGNCNFDLSEINCIPFDTAGNLNTNIETTICDKEEYTQKTSGEWGDWADSDTVAVVEVMNKTGYTVLMEKGDTGSRYVWSTDDVDNGGSIDSPNGWADTYPTREEAEEVLSELQDYAESKDMQNINFWIHEENLF